MDVVFLLDSSGSEGSVNFQKQLHFVKSFVEKFEIGPSNMQVSVVSFSTIVMENFDLKRYQSKYELLAAIDTIPYLSGTTHTDEAITFAVQHSFSAVSGDRTQAPNVIIVLTDGQSSSPSQTMHAAYQAHSAGITTFAIGIRTSDYIGELKYIASDPQNVFQASNFNALDQLQNVLSTKFCEGKYIYLILCKKKKSAYYLCQRKAKMIKNRRIHQSLKRKRTQPYIFKLNIPFLKA